MLRRLVVVLALLVAGAALAAPPAGRLPPDPALEARIADLLGRMTLEEKIGQMYLDAWSPDFDLDDARNGRLGGLSAPPDAARAAAIQKAARSSRLGIPLLLTRDIIHGTRTLFPVPLGLAASFDVRVMRSAARIAAREGRTTGFDFALGPMVDLSRDPRWGRVVEGPGEDPVLARLFAEASVRGLADGGLSATMKHFVGYGAVRGGRDYAEVDLSETALHDLYLPPFRAGIDAGAQVVMAAFNTVNGVPVTADHRLLTELLKEQWGFDGFVLSDWDAVRELIPHGVAAGPEEAVEKAVLAGIDMEMATGLFPKYLPGLVRSGRVPMARIDDAVTRILRVKFRLGLFDTPTRVIDPTAEAQELGSDENREAARDAARRSIVLLKNDGDVLPLVRPPRRIAVIGAAATDPSDLMGSWGAAARTSETPRVLDEVRARLKPLGTTVTFAEGCDDACTTTDGFAAAVATAKAADLIVAVLGEPWYMTAEGTSRTTLGLPGHQQALLDRLAATGKPVVLIVLAGRPMVLTDVVDRAKAILYAFSPGTMGAPALVDLLTGAASPSARLPMTMPRAVGQIPITYDMLPTGRPPEREDDDLSARWIDAPGTPLFPFGFGLAYARFHYHDLKVETPKLGLSDHLRVSAEVTASGTRLAREVAQLYVHDVVASRSRPSRELKAITILDDMAPGETRRVAFDVPVSDLGFHDETGAWHVEHGRFRVFVGGSSAAKLAADVEVTDQREPNSRR